LQKSQNDARDLGSLLTSSGSYNVVKVMSSDLDFVDPLFPTRDNIITQVDQLNRIAKPDDVIVFFFSGHGVNDRESGDSYLLTVDTKTNNLTSTALNLQKDVLGRFEAAKAGSVIALVDACQKNLSNDKGLSVVGVDKVKQAARAVIITSTNPGAASYEDPKGSNGLFTKGLLAGMEGAADSNHDGELSLQELRAYLPDAVSELAFGANYTQTPVVYDPNVDGRMVSLGKPGKRVVAAAAPVAQPAVMGKPAPVPEAPAKTTTQNFTVNSVGMKMVAVVGNDFEVWNRNKKDIARLSNYWISATEVTQAQYESVMLTLPKANSNKGNNLPVLLSWFDAITFCNGLSAKEGYAAVYDINGKQVKADFSKDGYRLPTTAEWTFAAMGGSPAPFYSEDKTTELNLVAWYQWSTNYSGKIHEVAQKKPNGYQMYDVSGNVWEWCWDWYSNGGGYNTQLGGVNPKGPETGKARVIMGGSAKSSPSDCKIDFIGRGADPANNGGSDLIGLRLVRTAVEVSK
jgi:formylglycine-generating enzyme required for sulfatase activity